MVNKFHFANIIRLHRVPCTCLAVYVNIVTVNLFKPPGHGQLPGTLNACRKPSHEQEPPGSEYDTRILEALMKETTDANICHQCFAHSVLSLSCANSNAARVVCNFMPNFYQNFN